MMVPLFRGDVYRGMVHQLRDPATHMITPVAKRMLVLHSDADLPAAIDFTFLICSTDHGKYPIRAYEVGFDPANVPGLDPHEFDRPARIDCRWVRTERRESVLQGAQLLGRLPAALIDEVDAALVVGLTMGAQSGGAGP